MGIGETFSKVWKKTAAIAVISAIAATIMGTFNLATAGLFFELLAVAILFGVPVIVGYLAGRNSQATNASGKIIAGLVAGFVYGIIFSVLGIIVLFIIPLLSSLLSGTPNDLGNLTSTLILIYNPMYAIPGSIIESIILATIGGILYSVKKTIENRFMNLNKGK